MLHCSSCLLSHRRRRCHRQRCPSTHCVPLLLQMVSAEELSALAQEYTSGARSNVSARFLSVVREGASAAATPAGSEPVPPQNGSDGVAHAAAASPLVAHYQRLYAVAVLQSLQSCLELPEAAAAGVLKDLAPEPVPSVGMHEDQQVASQLEATLSAAGEAPQIEKEHRVSQQASAGWSAGRRGGCASPLPEQPPCSTPCLSATSICAVFAAQTVAHSRSKPAVECLPGTLTVVRGSHRRALSSQTPATKVIFRASECAGGRRQRHIRAP